jgi:peroxiredoxin
LLAALGAIVTVLLLYNNPSNQSASKHALQLILLLGIGHALVTTLGAQLWERADKAAAASTVGLKEGQLAPDFELTDVSGQRRKLSELRGQTVVVNFWATWCPPCRAEMPELQAFYMRYKDQGVTMLAVNAANTETSEGYVAAWLKERGLSFPVVYDSAGEVTKAYRVSAYPSTIIVGPDGLIRTKKQGPMSSVTLSMATGVR